MNARICTNPNCHAIQPGGKCHLCRTATQEIPPIPLHAIGVDGAARLVHEDSHGYSIAITTFSGPRHVRISIADLLHSAQLQLPQLNPAGGLAIMDAIKNASSLIRTRNTELWSGWVIYLLEVLQDHADPAAFLQVLRNIQQDVDNSIIEGEEHMPMYNAIELHEVELLEGADNLTGKSA